MSSKAILWLSSTINNCVEEELFMTSRVRGQARAAV